MPAARTDGPGTRRCADFAQFAEMSENRETGWRSRRDLNSSALFAVILKETLVGADVNSIISTDRH